MSHTLVVMMTTASIVLGLLGVTAPTSPPGPTLDPPIAGPPRFSAPASEWKEDPKRGVGMIVTGSVFSALGVVLTVTAANAFAADARCHRERRSECWAGLGGAILMPFAMTGLAVGAPLLGVGIYRNRVWRAWQRESRLTLRPRFGRSGGGWFLGVALRFGLAALVLVPIAWLRGRATFRDPVAWRLAALVGVSSFGVGYGCTYLGGMYVPSGLGSLTFGVFPFWVAVLAHFILGDRLSAGKLAAIAVGLGGLVTLYWGSLQALGWNAAFGVAIITLSVLVQGFSQVYVKRDGADVPSAFMSGVGMGVGSLVLVAMAGLNRRAALR